MKQSEPKRFILFEKAGFSVDPCSKAFEVTGGVGGLDRITAKMPGDTDVEIASGARSKIANGKTRPQGSAGHPAPEKIIKE